MCSTANGRCGSATSTAPAGSGWTRPARHIQDIGQDQLREMGFEETHPLWIVRRTMVDLIRPIEFQDMLRMRRWCSGTSNRWCEMRVRIDGRKRRPDRIRGVLDQHQPGNPDAGAHRRRLPGRVCTRTTSVDRLRWKGYLKPGSRDDATRSTSSRSGSPTSTCSTT